MNELGELQLLLDELVSTILSTIQSGETLSDDFQGLLASELLYISERIDLLKTQAAQESVPPLNKAPFQSAVVNSFKYDPKSQDLFVKFQGDFPQENGNVYKYSGIPKFIADIFSQGTVGPKTTGKNKWHAWFQNVLPSHGAALNALIKKGGFQYKKVA